jgi:hypothetical protein
MIKDNRKPYSLVPVHAHVCKAGIENWWREDDDDRKPYSLAPVHSRVYKAGH